MQSVFMRHAEFLEISKYNEANSFDLVFTSPPFKEEDVDGDYWPLYKKWWWEMCRVASKAVIVIHSATKLNTLISEFPPKRVLIWGKGISKYSYRWNPVLVYQMSDDYKVNKFIWSDAFGVPAVNGKGKEHKYQDPLILYQTILSMFKGCKTVLDPFMGSGTTAIACSRLGLDFTGYEMDLENYAVAVRRSEMEERGLLDEKGLVIPASRAGLITP